MDRYHCTQCGRELTWVPQYERWYCYTCQAYAGTGGVGGRAAKVLEEGACPKCEQQMQYIHLYQAWYCPYCRSYKTLQGPTTNVPCPACRHIGLVYSYTYRRWYCPTCMNYPEISEVGGARAAVQAEKAAGRTVIDDIFLMYNDGRLIRHYTRRL
ncbi:MAG: hypothetical protein AB1665_08575, partial [Candidatus Thermoplasmatota archaeon]